MVEFDFGSWTMQFHCSKKSLFLPFLDIKPFFAMKMTNHHDKQLTLSERWDQDGFFEPGFGYHQLQISGLEFLQRCGHQIRVNTWTGSNMFWFESMSTIKRLESNM